MKNEQHQIGERAAQKEDEKNAASTLDVPGTILDPRRKQHRLIGRHDCTRMGGNQNTYSRETQAKKRADVPKQDQWDRMERAEQKRRRKSKKNGAM